MQTTTTSKGFIFDMNKCVGCQACSLACSIENNNGVPFQWRNIHSSNELNYSQAPLFYLSLACNHCEDAPCVKGCPTTAYSRDEKTNAVLIDSQKCIGCSYCSWVCPYDAPKMDEHEGFMQKCTFCTQRLEENKKPACATNCPVGALDYGNISLNANLVTGFTEVAIQPNIQIIPIKEKRSQPEMDIEMVKPKDEEEIRIHSQPKEKIELKHEWGLAIFTFIIPILIGYYFTCLFSNVYFYPNLFFAVAVLGVTISLVHLKKPFKAYKAIFNLKNSWLSREIGFFSLFIVVMAVGYYLNLKSIALLLISILLGIMTLISVDMVYRKTALINKYFIHSGEATVIAAFVFVIFFPKLAIPALVVKNLFYLYRKFIFIKNVESSILNFTVLKVLFGVIVPLIFITNNFYWAIGSILIGEFIERLEFYKDLKLITPQKQIQKDLADVKS